MSLFKNKYRIESTRLKNYDYSSDGAYFITICTKNRQHFFGEIIDNRLTDKKQAGIIQQCWFDLPNHYPNCILDKFIVMPNHVHGLIFIDNRMNGVKRDDIKNKFDVINTPVETGLKPVSTINGNTIKNNQCNNQYPKRYSLSEIIRGFKTFTAREINKMQNTPGQPLWQPRFYDHVVRNECTLNRIRRYIVNNPIKWQRDRNNKENVYM